MKSLLKRLSPFAPDQSGAVSVLFEFGGIIVILDAGGCTGNICGFDEPRWFTRKSALFSAGLRDMDAILGSDEKLIRKLQDTCQGTSLNFSALIGTPVPAIIATDFKALKHMAEKRTGLPALTIETTGTNLYDHGEEMAYLALFRQFSGEKQAVRKDRVGVLGATPLEISRTDSRNIADLLQNWNEIVIYGMGAGLDAVRDASSVEKNLVMTPAAVKTAEYLRQKYGTPWEIWTPVPQSLPNLSGRKVLIVHQQFMANGIRNRIPQADVASWFMMLPEYMRSGDFRLTDEEQFAEQAARYDVIIGDIKLKRVLRNWQGTFMDLPHYAVSGRLEK